MASVRKDALQLAHQGPSDNAFVPKSRACRCLHDFWRSLPICNILCCTLGVFGAAIGISCKGRLDDTLRDLFSSRSSSEVNFAIACLNWSYIASLIVFGLAFIVGIIGTGVSRERIFGRGGSQPARCSRFFAGPVFTRLVQILLLHVYVVQLLMSHLFAVISFLVFFMDAACQSGPPAINALTQLSTFMNDANQHGSGGVFDGVQEFCSDAVDVRTAAVRMFVASAFIVVSLTPLLASVTSTKERIRAQLREASKLKYQSMESDATGLSDVQCEEDQPKGESAVTSEAPCAQEDLSLESQSPAPSPTHLRQEMAELKHQLECRTAELAQECQQRVAKESELTEVHNRAEQQLGKWRAAAATANAAASSLARFQLKHDAATNANSTAYSPNIQKTAYQQPPLDRAHGSAQETQPALSDRLADGGTQKDMAQSLDASTPRTGGRRRRSSKLLKGVPSGVELATAPLEPPLATQTPGPVYFSTAVQNTPMPKRALRRNSRSLRRSNSSQGPVQEIPGPEPMNLAVIE